MTHKASGNFVRSPADRSGGRLYGLPPEGSGIRREKDEAEKIGRHVTTPLSSLSN